MRGLRVAQLIGWAGALGYRVEVLFWEPIEAIDGDAGDVGLDARTLDVLSEVAAALPHMPVPARQALSHEMQLWREEALRADVSRDG